MELNYTDEPTDGGFQFTDEPTEEEVRKPSGVFQYTDEPTEGGFQYTDEPTEDSQDEKSTKTEKKPPKKEDFKFSREEVDKINMEVQSQADYGKSGASIGRGLARSVTTEIPKIAGGAIKWFGDQTAKGQSPLYPPGYISGKKILELAQGEGPIREPGETTHPSNVPGYEKYIGEKVRTSGDRLQKWAEESQKDWYGDPSKRPALERWTEEGFAMLGPSLIPTTSITTGLRMLTGVSKFINLAKEAEIAGDAIKSAEYLSKAKDGAKLALSVASTTTASVFGMSEAQSVRDEATEKAAKLLKEGRIDEARKLMAVADSLWPEVSGLFEAIGEKVGTKYLGKLLGLDEAVAVKKGLKEMLLMFLKTLGVEVGTEYGQQTSEQGVRKVTGIIPDSWGKIFKDSLEVVPPVFISTIVTAGLGHARSRMMGGSAEEGDNSITDGRKLTPAEMDATKAALGDSSGTSGGKSKNIDSAFEESVEEVKQELHPKEKLEEIREKIFGPVLNLQPVPEEEIIKREDRVRREQLAERDRIAGLKQELPKEPEPERAFQQFEIPETLPETEDERVGREAKENEEKVTRGASVAATTLYDQWTAALGEGGLSAIPSKLEQDEAFVAWAIKANAPATYSEEDIAKAKRIEEQDLDDKAQKDWANKAANPIYTEAGSFNTGTPDFVADTKVNEEKGQATQKAEVGEAVKKIQEDQAKAEEEKKNQAVQTKLALDRQRAVDNASESTRFYKSIETPEGVLSETSTALTKVEASEDPIVKSAAAPMRGTHKALTTQETNPNKLKSLSYDLGVAAGNLKGQPRLQALVNALKLQADQRVTQLNLQKLSMDRAKLDNEKARELEKENKAKASNQAQDQRSTPSPTKATPAPEKKASDSQGNAEAKAKRVSELEKKVLEGIARDREVAAKKTKENLAAKSTKKERWVDATKATDETSEEPLIAITKQGEKEVKPKEASASQVDLKYVEDMIMSGDKEIVTELSHIAGIGGRDQFQDWMNPGKMYARLIQRMTREGVPLYRAKEEALKPIERYAKVYDAVLDSIATEETQADEKTTGKKSGGGPKAVLRKKQSPQHLIKRDVDEIIQAAKISLAKTANLVSLSSSRDLREVNPWLYNHMEGQGVHGKSKGVWDGRGNIYLFADMLSDVNDIRTVLKHELGHFSLDDLLGDNLNSVLDRVKSKYMAEIEERIKYYGWKSTIETRRQIANEIIIERYIDGSDLTLKSRVTDQVKKFFRRLGLVDQLTTEEQLEQDAADLVRAIHDNLVKGKPDTKTVARLKGVATDAWTTTVADVGSAKAQYVLNKLQWKSNQELEIFGTLNNRMGKELEIFERIFGESPLAEMLPGKVDTEAKKGQPKRPLKRSITPHNLGLEIQRIIKEGKVKQLLDTKKTYAQILTQMGFKDIAKYADDFVALMTAPNNTNHAIKEPAFTLWAKGKGIKYSDWADRLRIMEDLYAVREGSILNDHNAWEDTDEGTESSGILSKNGKAGASVDFLLGTCQPSLPCSECYAAEKMIRRATVQKAFRNTLQVWTDPKQFAENIAKEVAAIPKTKLPFVRLLGSGDLTLDEQVKAFNHLAEICDRPIQIFSRHHNNLAKLNGTKKAPFIKMGSIDAQLYEFYGLEKLKKNFDKHGISNAFLFTDKSEIPMIKALYDAHALGLVLAADHKLQKLLPKELQEASCPCDAAARVYWGSCRLCALSEEGCFMAFAGKSFDADGNIYDTMKVPKGVESWPYTHFLEGVKEKAGVNAKAQTYAEIARGIIAKSISLLTGYRKDFVAGDKKSVPLKDQRFQFLRTDKILRADNVEEIDTYLGNLRKMKDEIDNGNFVINPRDNIQGVVNFENWKRKKFEATESDATDMPEKHDPQHYIPTRAPKKTQKGYKLFRQLKTQPGKIFPLFVGKGNAIPMGQWLAAEALNTDAQRQGLAQRPGWHLGMLPNTQHLTEKDRVWAEVEIPADVEYQTEADKSPTKDIKNKIPAGGHYRYPVPARQGGTWYIAGSIKVNKILSQEEVNQIREGNTPQYFNMKSGREYHNDNLEELSKLNPTKAEQKELAEERDREYKIIQKVRDENPPPSSKNEFFGLPKDERDRLMGEWRDSYNDKVSKALKIAPQYDLGAKAFSNAEITKRTKNRYEDTLRETIAAINKADIENGETQPWSVVPAAKVKKLWNDFVRDGYVRDEKGMDKIAERTIQNVIQICVNTDLLTGPVGDINRKIWESIEDKERGFWGDSPSGMDIASYLSMDGVEDKVYGNSDATRTSDFGIRLSDAYNLISAFTAEGKLVAVDQLFNKVHQRYDLASVFIEGGRETLDEMAGRVKESNLTEKERKGYESGKDALEKMGLPRDYHLFSMVEKPPENKPSIPRNATLSEMKAIMDKWNNENKQVQYFMHADMMTAKDKYPRGTGVKAKHFYYHLAAHGTFDIMGTSIEKVREKIIRQWGLSRLSDNVPIWERTPEEREIFKYMGANRAEEGRRKPTPQYLTADTMVKQLLSTDAPPKKVAALKTFMEKIDGKYAGLLDVIKSITHAKLKGEHGETLGKNIRLDTLDEMTLGHEIGEVLMGGSNIARGRLRQDQNKEDIADAVAHRLMEDAGLKTKTPSDQVIFAMDRADDLLRPYETSKKLEELEEILDIVYESDKPAPQYAMAGDIKAKAFKSWFGKSKVVDENKKPKVVYHGSTHDFDEFKLDKSNPDNWYGKLHYFTDEAQDADENYHNRGPDLKHKINRRAERIYEERYSIQTPPPYGSKAYEAAMGKAKKQAEKELVGKTPSVYPVYLKMENPLKVLPGSEGTYFDYYMDDETGKESGSSIDLYNSVMNAADNYGADGEKLWVEVTEALGPEFSAYDFDHTVRQSRFLELLYEDSKENDSVYVGSEFLKNVYLNAGFDGIIIDASKTFMSMELPGGTRHYMVPESTQVKSIFNKGTWSKSNPKIQYYTSPFGPRGNVNPVNALKLTMMDKVKAYVVDSKLALKKLEGGDYDAATSGFKSFKLLHSFPTIFNQFLTQGTPKFVDNWMQMSKSKEGGILPIMKGLGEDVAPFFDRLTAKSAQELVSNGRSELFGLDEQGNMQDDQTMIDEIFRSTQSMYDANRKAWDEAEKRLREINKDVLDFCEDTGIIDADKRAEWERVNYVPFFRVMEEWGTGDASAILPDAGKNIYTTHQLKGGSEKNLADPLANLVHQYSSLLYSGLKNVARKKSLAFAKSAGLLEEIKWFPDRKEGKNEIDIRVKGKAKRFRVNDPWLYDALVDIDTQTKSLSIFSIPKRALTWGVTITGGFRLANIFRDTLHTFFIGNHFIPVWDSLRGTFHAFRNSPEFVEYASTGGAFGGSFATHEMRGKTEEQVKKLHKLAENKNSWWSTAWSAWEKVGEASENAARMGLYLRLRDKGMGAADAGFQARDLLDFHSSGKAAWMQFMISSIPFLNARVQGLAKMGRNATDKNTRAQFWTRSLLLAAGSLMWGFWHADDDDDKEKPDYLKRTYFTFTVAGEKIRLPIPFEVGSIFMVLPMALGERMANTRSNWEMYKITRDILVDTFAFNPLPQVIKPAIEQWTNYDTFTGQNIISEYQQKMEPDLQTNPKTREIYKSIGAGMQKLGFRSAASPKRIEKFVRDSFGSVADNIADFMDMGINLFTQRDPAGSDMERVLKISGASRFVDTQDVPAFTKSQERFYEMLKEFDTAATSYKEYKKLGDREKAREYRSENREEIRMSKTFGKYQDRIGVINAKMKLVHVSTRLTPEEKKTQLNALLEKRNSIFKRAVDRAQNKLEGHDD